MWRGSSLKVAVRKQLRRLRNTTGLTTLGKYAASGAVPVANATCRNATFHQSKL